MPVAGVGYMMHYKEFKELLQLWLLHPNDENIAEIASKVLNGSFWDFHLHADGSLKKVVRVTNGAKWLNALFRRSLLREARNIQAALRNFIEVVQGLEESRNAIKERIGKNHQHALETDLKQVCSMQDKIGAVLWQMEQYAALNYKAFYKILHKYDRHLHINALQGYMPIIDRMLSFKVRLEMPMFDEIYEEVDVLVITEDDEEIVAPMTSPLSSYEVMASKMNDDENDEDSDDDQPQGPVQQKICQVVRAWLPQLIPPIIQTVAEKYGRKQFQDDVICSIVISLAGIPKAMSYAGLAGVPVTAGIATLYMPCLVYALLGSSRQIAISPQSVTCLLLAQLVDDSLGSSPANDAEERMALTMMFTMSSGFVMAACGLLNLSMLFNFISRPVLSGFISASALIAAFSTVKSLLGIHVKKSPVLHTLIGRIFEALPDIHLPTACISFIGVIMLVSLPLGKKATLRNLEHMQRCRPCTKLLWFVLQVPLVIYIMILAIFLGGYLCKFNAFVEESTQHVVTGVGATSIAPFYEQIGQRFTCEHQSDNVEVTYKAEGSGAGLREIMRNDTLTFDFAASDVLPPQEELSAYNVSAFPVAAAFICPMVNIPMIENLEQITLVLDMSTVASIFFGEITSWTDERIRSLNPNLPWDAVFANIPITVITRSDPSGTTAVFAEALSNNFPMSDGNSSGLNVNWKAPVQKQVVGNEGVIQAILSTPWSIGYTSWSNESKAEISCAGFPIEGGIVTTKLAWKQRVGSFHTSYHQFLWPIKLVNYMLVPSLDNAHRISTNDPREDVCAARRWLHQYLEFTQKSESIAKLYMFELMEFMDGISGILCSNDRHLSSQQLSENDYFECEKEEAKCSDIKMVGYFPRSFLNFEFHNPKTELSFGTIFTNSLFISAVAVLEHVANAKLYSERNGYHVSISKDLVAVGMSNVFGSCFGSFIVAGGFSRSALNAKAASQVSGLLSVFVSVLVVFTMAPLLSMLPDCVLNIILFVSVIKVIDYKLVLHLVRLRQRGLGDLLSLGFAFACTCFLGVVTGMIVSMGFSLIIFVLNSAYPQILLLQRTPGATTYEAQSAQQSSTDICGFQVQLPRLDFSSSKPESDDPTYITILRCEAPLWYANVGRLCDRVLDELLSGTQGIVFDMSNVSWVDVTACSELKTMLARVDDVRVHAVFANTNTEVEYMIKTTCDVQDSRFFRSLYKAEMAAELWGQEGDIKTAIGEGLQEVEAPKSKFSKRMPTMAW